MGVGGEGGHPLSLGVGGGDPMGGQSSVYILSPLVNSKCMHAVRCCGPIEAYLVMFMLILILT